MTLTAADYAEMKRRLAADVLSVDVLHVKGDVDLNSLKPRNAIILGNSPGAAGQVIESQGPNKAPQWGSGGGNVLVWPLTANTATLLDSDSNSILVWEDPTASNPFFSNGTLVGGDVVFRKVVSALNVSFNAGELAASQFVLWLDDTPGATVLHFEAKDSGGTHRTASINLT